MGLAHKYLQMGLNAKYPGGQKYEDDGTERAAAVVFRDAWQRVTEDPAYQRLKERHQKAVCEPDVRPMTAR